MQINTYLNHLDDLNFFKNLGIEEVILAPRELSTLGKISLNESLQLAEAALTAGLRPVLEWDILMTEKVFAQKIEQLNGFSWEKFKAVRLQDHGALEWVKQNKPQIPMQIILENGHHNLTSIQSYENYFAGQVERLILSLELTRESLTEYCRQLKTPIELMILGKILLFYTPRGLLTPLHDKSEFWLDKGKEGSSPLVAIAKSEESHHKNFSVIENAHGTFMFYSKDHSLGPHLNDLEKIGISYGRIDLRALMQTTPLIKKEIMVEFLKLRNQGSSDLEKIYPCPLIHGFYLTNRTDVLFPKLKNSRLVPKGSDFLGEVIAVEKKQYMVVKLVSESNKIKIKDKIELINPEGEKILSEVEFIKDFDLTLHEEIQSPQFFIMNWVKGVNVRSVLYKIGDN